MSDSLRTDKRIAAEQVAALAEWIAALRWEQVPPEVRQRLSAVLLDTLAVTAAGARTADQARIRAGWPQPPGGAPVLGAGVLTTVDAAAFLNAGALVCCELDEGNKYARGHPAAHSLPAILALAADSGASGERTALALLAGYEVAARFGRATVLHNGVHPHGSWGIAGAAAGCSVLLGLPAAAVAAAIDTAAGLPIAGRFDSALDGHRVRDAWVGAGALSGLTAARLAQAGVVRNSGTAALTLGTLLGRFAPDRLTAGLGADWLILGNYFKRHASCSYTHPAADLAIELRDRHLTGLTPEQIADRVEELAVATHSLAAPLDRTDWDSPLAAMFSVPYAVSAALLYGEVAPATADRGPREDPLLRRLAARVAVGEDPALTAQLPDRRAAELHARLADGRSLRLSAPNPVGDSDHRPFDDAALSAMLAGLLGDRAAVDAFARAATALPGAPDAGELLRPLAAEGIRTR
ncbi:MmgE/PrpD family protein [Phaeacidiphilus oryzae]|uniref:MmgE/PrpD family protein n=1 Tax=Phaeacidiphilus oryzae TaxID=348818 RepID=UPI0005655AD6|nr:MmgE/PrpD family protein [Phaeacidiphilus oryzae]